MIVITSIFPPTAAVELFRDLDPGEVIVVGDRKTPPDWRLEGVEYLGVEAQVASPLRLAKRLPWDHYARKNLGYLRAIERSASVIRESDDDNLPYPDWHFPDFVGQHDVLGGREYVNIYAEYTQDRVWPRGLPLDEVLSASGDVIGRQSSQIGVWQGLADGDPDVDAIYRLTVGAPIDFDRSVPPRVLDLGTVCPFNSQNTAFAREAFALLYLPSTVTFRFTDILRGLVAQPILWAAGLRLGFTTSTVRQERNEHDFLRDFESEIPCYLHSRDVVATVLASVTPDLSIEENLERAYRSLADAGFVEEEESRLVDAWLADLRDVSGSSCA